MPLYYNVGGTFVSEEELVEKRDQVEKFQNKSLKNITFSTGDASHDTAPPEQFKKPVTTKTASVAAAAAANLEEFQPIGPNKPLTIWIASAYVGSLAPKGIFGGGRGSMVSTAVKSWQTFDRQPRALNMIKKSVRKKDHLSVLAVEDGTPIVFYSKAVLDRQLTLAAEMAFDDVDENFFKSIGSVFSAAAGLPIFAAAAPYLLAAQTLVNLGGTIGNRIFDNRAEFQAGTEIYFEQAGKPSSKAGYALLTRSLMDAKTLTDYTVSPDGKLVRKDDANAAYEGDTAYMILALDGREDSDLDEFKATAASAALMQQFYNVREGGETDADILITALKFYNDFHFRQEADKLKKEIDSLPAGSDKRKKLEERYEAIKKNIQSDQFRP
jgi:hypothetical protein